MPPTRTSDSIYRSAAEGEFAAMLDVERHAEHNDAFEALFSASHDHYWDPLDNRYIEENEGENAIANDIAEDGIAFLKEIDTDRMVIGKR